MEDKASRPGQSRVGASARLRYEYGMNARTRGSGLAHERGMANAERAIFLIHTQTRAENGRRFPQIPRKREQRKTIRKKGNGA